MGEDIKLHAQNWIQGKCPNSDWKKYLLGLIDGKKSNKADTALVEKNAQLKEQLAVFEANLETALDVSENVKEDGEDKKS